MTNYNRIPLVMGFIGAVALVSAGIRCACPSAPDEEALRFSTIASQQLGAAQTSFAGTVDPTAIAGPAGNAPLLPCLNSCTSVAEQNRAAIKTTFDYAAANRMIVYIPPGEYPIARAAGQSYGIDITVDNLAVLARNVTFRFTGDQTSSAGAMVRVRANNVKIEGATFSLRDVTNPTSDTVALLVGDGGTTPVDQVSLVDDQFVEGATSSGDYVRVDGGTTAEKITRLQIQRCRFDDGKRAAVDVRPGVALLDVSYNFFRNNARAIYFEDTGDGPIGKSTILGNFIEHNATTDAVTLSGDGGANVSEQSLFAFNRIIRPIASATGGGALYAKALARTKIAYNHITTANASGPSLFLEGAITDVSVIDNFVERKAAASDASAIKVADDGATAPSGVVVRGNRVRQAAGISDGIEVQSCARCFVTLNRISYHAATGDSGATGFRAIQCKSTSVGKCSGNISRNVARREDQEIRASLNLSTKTAHDDTVVAFFREGVEGNSATIAFVGDSGVTAGSVTGTTLAKTVHFRPGFTTVANVETLLTNGSIRVQTSGTGSNILQAGDAFSATALAGAAQAGRMLAGIDIAKNSTTVGALTIRDNFIDGARAMIYSDANGSTDFPEGYPLISGNGYPTSGFGVVNEFENGIATWVTESTPAAEVVATGACSASKEVTFLTAASSATVTQPDGIRDGQRHCFKVKTATSCAPCTWAPTHFADGTTHTISWTGATDVSWCAVWESAATTWRLVSKSSGATLN